MKRTFAILGLLWFVVGVVLMPSAHLLEHLPEDSETCCACHGHAAPADTPADHQPEEPSHDSSTCLICQFSAMAYDMMPEVSVTTGAGQIVCIVFPVPSTPDVQAPRLLPFICGPPVGFCSLHI